MGETAKTPAQFARPSVGKTPFTITSIAVAGMLGAGIGSNRPANADIYTRALTEGRRDNSSQLLAEISALKSRVAKLEAAIEIVDELDWDSALERARKFFTEQTRNNIYPPELADHLGTSVSQAIDLCDALETEGIVVGA